MKRTESGKVNDMSWVIFLEQLLGALRISSEGYSVSLSHLDISDADNRPQIAFTGTRKNPFLAIAFAKARIWRLRLDHILDRTAHES